MNSAILSDRSVISLSGEADEQEAFLQDLLTNDVSAAQSDHLVYAALLTPQGKFLADMLIRRDAERNFKLDVATSLAEGLMKRLTMYKLRRPVTLELTDDAVGAIWNGEPPSGALIDPRHQELGWRVYGPDALAMGGDDYDLHRLTLGVPDAPVDLIPNDTYILEAGFEALSGVDFQKGCYVGQEIVARMKHKTELRKGYRLVDIEGVAEPGSAVLTEDGKTAGRLLSARDGLGLCHLRLDAVKGQKIYAENNTRVYLSIK